MKIVWVLLIGMFIFQGLFIVLGTNFFYLNDETMMDDPNPDDGSVYDLTASNPGGLWNMMTGTAGATVITIAAGFGIALALIYKNYAVAAIAMFLGFTSWLFLQTVNIFVTLNNYVDGGEIAIALIALFNAIIAILIIKDIMDRLAPGGVD